MLSAKTEIPEMKDPQSLRAWRRGVVASAFYALLKGVCRVH
jgi:hypothetical protein